MHLPNNEAVYDGVLRLKGFIEIKYALVEMVLDENYGGTKKEGAYKVKLLHTEQYGFVKVEDLYILSDYSLHIRKQPDGNWKITSFAPWD